MAEAGDVSFAVAQAEITRTQTEWTNLKALAGAGQLRFEPAAAEKCAQACQEVADKMEGYIRSAQNLSRVDGFGETDAGRALAGKFSKKADEAVRVLVAHRSVLWEMRDTYRAAGQAYAAIENSNTQLLGGSA